MLLFLSLEPPPRGSCGAAVDIWTGGAFSLPASKGWIRILSTLLLKTTRGRDLGLISGWNRSLSMLEETEQTGSRTEQMWNGFWIVGVDLWTGGAFSLPASKG